MWRRASVASDPSPPSETVQTDCSTVTQGDLSQISDQFIEPSTTPLMVEVLEKHLSHLRQQGLNQKLVLEPMLSMTTTTLLGGPWAEAAKAAVVSTF